MTLPEFCAPTPNSIRRGPFGSAIKKEFFVPSGYKVYEQQNAIYDDCELGNYFIDEQKFEELRSFEVGPGDIIISCSGTIGRIALLPAWAKKGVINQALLKLTLNNKVILPHYFRFLFHQKVDELIAGNVRGSAMVNITGVKDLKKILWPVPPLEEQRKIVAEIEKQFTRLEAGVAGLRRVQANLKRYRAAVLKAACEGRLVPTEAELARQRGEDRLKKVAAASRRWSPDQEQRRDASASLSISGENAGDGENRSRDGSATLEESYETGAQLLERILIERRKTWSGKGKYKEPASPGTANLPILPVGWTWARLDQLGFTFGGLTKNPKRAKLTKHLPYLRVANVYANELRLEEIARIGVEDSELEKLLLRPNDLLIVEGNGSKDQIGRLAIWDGSINPCVHQNHLIKVRPLFSEYAKWVLYWLLSPTGRQFVEIVASSTSGLYTLSVNKVGDLPITIPPLTEQQRIVAEVERRLSVVEELEAVVNANLQRATRLRQSILQRAFEGKLVETEHRERSFDADNLPLAAESPAGYERAR